MTPLFQLEKCAQHWCNAAALQGTARLEPLLLPCPERSMQWMLTRAHANDAARMSANMTLAVAMVWVAQALEFVLGLMSELRM